MTAPDPLAEKLVEVWAGVVRGWMYATTEVDSANLFTVLARAAREHLLAEATECSECGNACTCGRDEPEIDCPIHGLSREQLLERLDRQGREKTAAENEVERLRDALNRINRIATRGSITARAADAFTQERRWLDVLSIIERTAADA